MFRTQFQAKTLGVCPITHEDKNKNLNRKSYGNFIIDEYTHTLRLESKLSDLRVGDATPATSSPGEIPRTGICSALRGLRGRRRSNVANP